MKFIPCPEIENESQRVKVERQPFWVHTSQSEPEHVVVVWGPEEVFLESGESLCETIAGARLFERVKPDLARRMAYLLNAAADEVEGKIVRRTDSGYVRAEP